MKIVLLGDPQASWDELRPVLASLGEHDELVTTGALASRAEYLLKTYRRDHRQRPPTITVQRLETGKDKLDATRNLAMQLIAHHRPSQVVLIGEPDPVLQEETMHYADGALIPVISGEDFARERHAV